MTETTVRVASNVILGRYEDILLVCDFEDVPPSTGAKHLRWMCRTAREQTDWPEDKQARWLGFIQGVLVMRGLLSVEAERDATRPLFHAAYGRCVTSIAEPSTP